MVAEMRNSGSLDVVGVAGMAPTWGVCCRADTQDEGKGGQGRLETGVGHWATGAAAYLAGQRRGRGRLPSPPSHLLS